MALSPLPPMRDPEASTEAQRTKLIRLGDSESFVPSAQRESSLLEYWAVLRKRRWVVLSCLVIVTTLVAIFTFRMTPMYEAVSRIAIHRENPDVLGFGPDLEGRNTDDWDYIVALDTQVRVLESDTLALQVIKELQLDKDPAFWYQPASPDPSADPGGTSEANAREAALLSQLQGSLRVSAIPRTRIVEVRFQSPDPKLAATVVNAFTRLYIEHNFKTKFESTMQASTWLSKQLSDLQLKVETSQENLVRYQREHGMLGIDEKQNIITAKLDELNKELTTAETGRIQKEAAYRMAQSGSAELISSSSQPSLIATLREQEAELRKQYAQVTTQFGPSYPKVRELANQLAQVEFSIEAEIQKLAARIEQEYLGATLREKMLRAALEKQKGEANLLNQRSIQYTILKREADSNRELYEGLLQKLKEAGVAAGLKSSNIRIVDVARVPISPVKPNVPRNILLGILLGLAGGISLAFLLETLDNTVRFPEQVEIISGLPSLGIIPLTLNGDQRRNGRHKLALASEAGAPTAPVELISFSRPNSAIAESYRALRTSVLLSSLGAPPKVILITSALPQEGKTTTCINSAIVLAQKGGRVLLVDADLRRPGVSRILGLKPKAGLSNLLAGTENLENVIIPSPQLPNLFVLPSGPSPPHPSELLDSSIMKSYLHQWRREFDHVIIDTPPALSVTDSVLLSVEADAVILVIRSGQITKGALRRAADLFARVNAKVTGVVVNAVDLDAPDHYYYYGYQYGGSYYEEGPAQQDS